MTIEQFENTINDKTINDDLLSALRQLSDVEDAESVITANAIAGDDNWPVWKLPAV